MAQFIFGGDTGVADPQELQRRRAVLEALGQNARTAAPRNVGEGLNAIGQALAYRFGEKRLAKQEAGARQAATDKFGRVTSALLGGTSYAPPAMAAGPSVPPVQTTPMTPNPAGLPQSVIDAVDREAPLPPTSGGGQFAAVEAKYGLPAGYLDRTYMIESGGNPNAQNPNSSAGGGFQFIDSTAAQYGLTNKNDLAASADAAARLAADNRQALIGVLGREPTAAELYLAHQQGGGGAAALLSNPNARAVDIVGLDAVRLNGGDENMTAGQFAGKWINKFAGGSGGYSAPGGMAGPVDPTIINQLAELAADPYLPEGQRAVVEALLQKQLDQIGQTSDPLADIELQKAQLELEQMRTGRGGTTELSLTPQFATDANGNLVMLQVGKDGKAVQTEIPEGLELSRGIEKIDLGDSFVFMNILTGEQIGEPVPKNLGEAEREKAIGTATGKSEGDAAAQIEGARLKTQQALDLIDSIAGNPALDSIVGNMQGRQPAGLPWTGWQAGADVAADVENLQGKIFVQAYDAIRGAGQITEQEGAAAKAAIANLDRARSEGSYREALTELRKAMADLLALAEAKAARAGTNGAGGDTGTTYTFNPATGELE